MKRKVIGGSIQCVCELEHGKVTANPRWLFANQSGFVADPNVPENCAIYLRENGLTVVYSDLNGILRGLQDQERAKNLDDTGLQALLGQVLLEQVDFDPRKPPKPHLESRAEVWVLDDCTWDKPQDSGRKLRLYKKNRYVPQHVLWETKRIKMPLRIHYLKLTDPAVAEYIRERLEADRGLPSLPAENVVLR